MKDPRISDQELYQINAVRNFPWEHSTPLRIYLC